MMTDEQAKKLDDLHRAFMEPGPDGKPLIDKLRAMSQERDRRAWLTQQLYGALRVSAVVIGLFLATRQALDVWQEWKE
jgi:hypothetical protein